MGTWWWIWIAFMFLFLVPPIGYGWGYRGWGAPYPSYVQRRRGQAAIGRLGTVRSLRLGPRRRLRVDGAAGRRVLGVFRDLVALTWPRPAISLGRG